MKLFVVLLVAAVATAQSLDECLQKDSISCIQKSLYRKAKDFFSQENVEILKGVTLVKAEEDEAQRGARTSDRLAYDQKMEAETSVADRQNVLEKFIGNKVSSFISGRSLQVNFAPMMEEFSTSARALSDSVPQEVRQAVDEIVEGRGKKKILKTLLPLILAGVAKIGALATLTYFGIAFLAKKAILASLISIAISAFIGVRSLYAGQDHHHHAEVTAYNGGGGWSSGGTPSGGWSGGPPATGWEDPHASAYSGYQH